MVQLVNTVDEGEPLMQTGFWSTSAIGAMTAEAGRSTVGREESFHEVRVLNCCVQKPLLSAHQNLHELFQ
ncbi:hypothetical protein Tco_0701360 [Tanacetum coccineum]